MVAFVRRAVKYAIRLLEAIERGDLAYRNYIEIKSSSSDMMSVAQARVAYAEAIQRLDDFLKGKRALFGCGSIDH